MGSKGRHPVFGEEHEMFRSALRHFVENELKPHTEEWDKAEGFPRWVWNRLGELGYLGLRFPEECGGQNCDFMFESILAEELGKCGSSGLVASVVSSILATTVPFKFGSDENRRRFVKPAAKGQKIASIAMTEPDAGSDLASIRTRAERTADGWVIDGQKMFITNGTISDFIVTLVRTTSGTGYRGLSTLLVERGTPGFSSRKLNKVGNRLSDTAELTFDHCLVPASNLVGEEGKGFYQMMWELTGERILSACSCVGRAQPPFDAALNYVQQRIQFGQPIGDFQVIRHRLADMATQLEAARQLAYHSAWLYSNGENPIKESSMAKLMASQVAFKIADEALQMHGGYGYMMDSPIQRHWRDIRLYRISAGTDEIQKEIISGQLLPRARH